MFKVFNITVQTNANVNILILKDIERFFEVNVAQCVNIKGQYLPIPTQERQCCDIENHQKILKTLPFLK